MSSESEDDESLLHPLVADSALKLPTQPSSTRTKDDIKMDPARTKVKPKTQAKLFPDSESDGSSDNDSSLLPLNLGQSKRTVSVDAITDPLGVLNTPDPLGLVQPATVGKERKLSHRSDSNSSFESLRLDGDVVGEAELLSYIPGVAETESGELRREIKKVRTCVRVYGCVYHALSFKAATFHIICFPVYGNHTIVHYKLLFLLISS